MRTFFKNKKWMSNVLKKAPVFCFAFLLLSVTTYAVVHPLSAGAESWIPGVDSIGVAIVSSLNGVLSAIAQAILYLTGWILYASGIILREVIELSIFRMADIVNSDGVLSAWRTFRDIANMMFIFILLYIAVGTILGLGNINLKKMLARVVIVAILLNFSFFFTKVAVDASNIVTIGFYNQIIQTKCGPDNGTTGDIGSAFMCKMGLTSFWSQDTLVKIGEAEDGNWAATLKIVTSGIMGSVFFLIAAFVFMAAAIMFIARFIAFIFLFMLSPLAFASMALPNDKYSDQWKESLISNCLFAPIFMLMIWAVLKILNAVAIDPAGSTLANAVTGIGGGKPSPAAGLVLLNYAIIIGMIIGSLMVAKKFGEAGTKGILKSISGVQNWTQGRLGRGAVRVSGVSTIDRRLGDSQFGKSWAGRAFRGATTGLATNYNFGDKKGGSVQKVDKDRKKVQEDLAKDVIKGTEKTLDKKLPELRTTRISTLTDTLKQKDTEQFAIENDAEKLRIEIANDEKTYKEYTTRTGNEISKENRASLDDKKLRLKNLSQGANDLGNQKKSTETLIKTTTENAERKAVATKDEKTEWLPGIQEKKIEELEKKSSWVNPLSKILLASYRADKKKAADELKKLMRGASQKSTEEILKDLLAQTGEKPEEKKEEKKEPKK